MSRHNKVKDIEPNLIKHTVFLGSYFVIDGYQYSEMFSFLKDEQSKEVSQLYFLKIIISKLALDR